MRPNDALMTTISKKRLLSMRTKTVIGGGLFVLAGAAVLVLASCGGGGGGGSSSAADTTVTIGPSSVTVTPPSTWHSDSDGVHYVTLYSPNVISDEFSPPSVFIELVENTTIDQYALNEHLRTYAVQEHTTVDGHDALRLDDRSSPIPHKPYVVTLVDVAPSTLVITAEYVSFDDYTLILESIDIP